jgi:hypothetical protein
MGRLLQQESQAQTDLVKRKLTVFLKTGIDMRG